MKAGDEISEDQIKVGMVIRAASNYGRTVIEGEVSEVPGSAWGEVMIDHYFGFSASDYTITVVEVGAQELELINSVINALNAFDTSEEIAQNVIALVREADAA